MTALDAKVYPPVRYGGSSSPAGLRPAGRMPKTLAPFAPHGTWALAALQRLILHLIKYFYEDYFFFLILFFSEHKKRQTHLRICLIIILILNFLHYHFVNANIAAIPPPTTTKIALSIGLSINVNNKIKKIIINTIDTKEDINSPIHKPSL